MFRTEKEGIRADFKEKSHILIWVGVNIVSINIFMFKKECFHISKNPLLLKTFYKLEDTLDLLIEHYS